MSEKQLPMSSEPDKPAAFRRFTQMLAALSPAERRRLAVIAAAVIGLNLAGWGIFVLTIQPRHFNMQVWASDWGWP